MTGKLPQGALWIEQSHVHPLALPRILCNFQYGSEASLPQVEGGYYYTVALRSDGSVWTWGRNLLGELGISDTIRYRHTSGPVRIPQLSDVTAISTTGEDTV